MRGACQDWALESRTFFFCRLFLSPPDNRFCAAHQQTQFSQPQQPLGPPHILLQLAASAFYYNLGLSSSNNQAADPPIHHPRITSLLLTLILILDTPIEPIQSPMATPSTSPDASSTSSTKKYNLRNPLPLSATQEQEVKQLYYKRVRGYCADEIKGMYALLFLHQLHYSLPKNDPITFGSSQAHTSLTTNQTKPKQTLLTHRQ